jgi:hypothetical protein
VGLKRAALDNKKWPREGPFFLPQRCLVAMPDDHDPAVMVTEAVVAMAHHLGARTVVAVLDDDRLGAGDGRGHNAGGNDGCDDKSEFLHDAFLHFSGDVTATSPLRSAAIPGNF